MKILQLAHGTVFPEYISAYSLRVHSLIKKHDKKIVAIGGPVLKNFRSRETIQYRAVLLMIYSFIKRNRSFEIYLSKGKFISKKIIREIKREIENSDIIIYEGPWLYPLTEGFTKNKMIIYDAHNVEYELRKNNIFREETYKIEKSLVENSSVIFSFTENDAEKIKKLYSRNNVIVLRHIMDLPEYSWEGYNSRDIVFIGSIYSENIKALEKIGEFAENLKNFNFHIIGNLNRYPGRVKRKNIIYHGLLNEMEKDKIMKESFLALNPVTGGSGRNFKMVDYIFHGLPVLTTEIGARGFDDETRSLFYIENIDYFVERINEIDKNREELKDRSRKLYIQAKKIFENEYVDVDALIEKIYQEYLKTR
ncbi:MAG: glycosyltransferase [Thermoplasmata archaeon]